MREELCDGEPDGVMVVLGVHACVYVPLHHTDGACVRVCVIDGVCDRVPDCVLLPVGDCVRVWERVRDGVLVGVRVLVRVRERVLVFDGVSDGLSDDVGERLAEVDALCEGDMLCVALCEADCDNVPLDEPVMEADLVCDAVCDRVEVIVRVCDFVCDFVREFDAVNERDGVCELVAFCDGDTCAAASGGMRIRRRRQAPSMGSMVERRAMPLGKRRRGS